MYPSLACTENLNPHPPPPVHVYVLDVSIMRKGPTCLYVPNTCTTVPISNDDIDSSIPLQDPGRGGRRTSRARRGRGEYRPPPVQCSGAQGRLHLTAGYLAGRDRGILEQLKEDVRIPQRQVPEERIAGEQLRGVRSGVRSPASSPALLPPPVPRPCRRPPPRPWRQSRHPPPPFLA